MRPWPCFESAVLTTLLLSTLPAGVLGSNVLSTNGFTSCLSNSTIQVNTLNIQFDKDTGLVNFDVAGTNAKVQNVTANLQVSAYGRAVYSKSFNPCESGTYVQQLCPVPAGSFSASGSQVIPSQYLSMIPSIAFNIPDLDGLGKLELTSLDGAQPLACIQSGVTNGKTANVPAVKYVAVGVAAAALALSGVSALGAAAQPGGATSSPSFIQVIHWFQSMSMNGMLSVSYPAVYRSFTQNFAFSTGLIPWDTLQTSIDNFRASTGGNLTDDSVQYLRNSTLVYSSDLSNNKRSLAPSIVDRMFIYARDITTTVNGTSVSGGNGTTNGTTTANQPQNLVSGIQGYVESLTIPQANTFMTVLLVFAIILAAIIAGILLFKVILEAWALMASFPKRLSSFRKNYWWLVAKTCTNLILLLYGVWTMYCVYQFTNGDSWAAILLAAVTLGIFTAVLLGFTWKIWYMAKKYDKLDESTSVLYEDKETWRKYSLFYGDYKKSYWWLFVPAIVYMFAKGVVIAGLDGHGLAQTAGQLIVDSLMLLLLLWSRPYTLKSGNVINICVQVVRVLSVLCILVFVEELGLSQTTKTITGVVLIVIQAVLTAVLAILIAVNSLIFCIKTNPHRIRRKENAQKNRDLDNLTPLDAHNSMLMFPVETKDGGFKDGYVSTHTTEVYGSREPSPIRLHGEEQEHDLLANSGAGMGMRSMRERERNVSQDSIHMYGQPTLPGIAL